MLMEWVAGVPDSLPIEYEMADAFHIEEADNRLGIICLLLYHCAQMVSTMVMLWIRFMGPYTAKATETRRIRRMIPNSDQGMPHGSPHFCPISKIGRASCRERVCQYV